MNGAGICQLKLQVVKSCLQCVIDFKELFSSASCFDLRKDRPVLLHPEIVPIRHKEN